MYRSEVRRLPRPARRSSGFAALLSAIVPGLGQMYRSRWRRGLLMLAIPFVGFVLFAAAALFVGPVASAVVRHAALFVILLVGGLYAFHLVIVADAFAIHGEAGERRRVLDVALLLAVLLGLSLGYFSVYRHSQVWADVLSAVFEPAGRTVSAGTSPSDTSGPGWSGHERLNVLVLGLDTRQNDPQSWNTDTMIVLSIDPVARTAAMLSIPRDTLVEIPGYGQDKINSTFAHAGDLAKGPDLARRTVSAFLGVPIQAYAVVDFNAFQKTIDAVGGVLIDVRVPVRDEAYPDWAAGVQRIAFDAGPQVMDGASALRFARSRHESNDFSRAQRQQQVIFALRQRIEQKGLFQLPSIMERVGPLVRTDFDPGNVLPLARTVLGINTKEIRSAVLLPCDDPSASHCELTEQNGPSGYYLIPDLAKVRAFTEQLFAGTAPGSTD
ncbi:MAG: LCP family protein [Chloroflexota bacterium]|nr:LCP family protein [Chloroflexota bacterium]